jgi:hypothetical protein
MCILYIYYEFVFLFMFYYITGHSLNKENQSMLVNQGVSPPISARLRELSKNLKSLFSSTPLHEKLPEAIDASSYGQVSEPKTPTTEQSVRVYDRWEVANISSPWEALSMRSSGMKVRSNHFPNTFASCSLDFPIATHILFVVAELLCSRIY